MKTKIKFAPLIIVLIIILSFLIAYNILIFTNKPIYTKELKINFIVGDKIGLTINSTTLDYGILIPDTSSTKTINLTNYYNFPIKVKLLINPEMEGYIFSKNNFIIQPKQTAQNTFTLILPPDTKKGNYSGVAKLYFFKAN